MNSTLGNTLGVILRDADLEQLSTTGFAFIVITNGPSKTALDELFEQSDSGEITVRDRFRNYVGRMFVEKGEIDYCYTVVKPNRPAAVAAAKAKRKAKDLWQAADKVLNGPPQSK